jgi:hypothetical protein
VRGAIPGAGLGEGVLGREWGIRGRMAAPYKPPGGPGWGIWGPVHYIRGRLAFMKAEFEISNAQEQLWEAFTEALRDFLKARSRPDIGGPVGTAGLPERLAMRERDLTSDLESLRQRKAIIETFYAGLTEDQPRAADQLAPARAENLHHLRFCAGVRSRGMRTNCARSFQTASTTASTAQFLDWFKRPFPNQGIFEYTRQLARKRPATDNRNPLDPNGPSDTWSGLPTRAGRAEPRRSAPAPSHRRELRAEDLLVPLCLPPLRNRPGVELNMKRGNFPFSRVGPTVRIRFPPAANLVRTTRRQAVLVNLRTGYSDPNERYRGCRSLPGSARRASRAVGRRRFLPWHFLSSPQAAGCYDP